MKRQLLTGALAAGALAIGFMGQMDPAEAFTFSFSSITNSKATDAAIGESQLFVDITEYSSNQVSFLFQNIGSAASSITDIYFENRSAGLLVPPNPTFIASTGVDFSLSASPGNLPGANGADPDFQASTTNLYTADSNPPAQPNGINPGETLEIIYTLATGVDFDDIINALQNPDFAQGGTSLRIGLHVQGFAGGGSESFVNNRTPVPAPALIPSLLGVGIAALRKKKREDELAEDNMQEPEYSQV